MSVQRVSSGAPWEKRHGYCRAVRHGDRVFVSGTTAVAADGHVAGDAFEQTRRCLDIIAAALGELGLSMKDVVRTRLFLTDIDDWPEVARAHAEVFAEQPPASTMLEVSRLIDPAMRVEIEADAICGSTGSNNSEAS